MTALLFIVGMFLLALILMGAALWIANYDQQQAEQGAREDFFFEEAPEETPKGKGQSA